MSIGEIINFTYDWVTIFGGFLEMLMKPLSEIVEPIGITLPDMLTNATLFGVLFQSGFVIIVALILIKFIIGIVT